MVCGAYGPCFGDTRPQNEPLSIAAGPDVVLPWVARAGRDLIVAAGRDVDDLAGLGLGLPGPVEHSTGRPSNPPIMPGWDDVDVPGTLDAELGVDVLVDNDVNIMALGEHRAAWPRVSDLLLRKVSTGIGAGIIADGGGVVALVRSPGHTASQAVRQAGRDISGVLAGADAGEHLIAGIREAVYRRSLPLATQHLRIVTSRARAGAGVLGASAMAIDHVLSPGAIDTLVGTTP